MNLEKQSDLTVIIKWYNMIKVWWLQINLSSQTQITIIFWVLIVTSFNKVSPLCYANYSKSYGKFIRKINNTDLVECLQIIWIDSKHMRNIWRYIHLPPIVIVCSIKWNAWHLGCCKKRYDNMNVPLMYNSIW